MGAFAFFADERVLKKRAVLCIYNLRITTMVLWKMFSLEIG